MTRLIRSGLGRAALSLGIAVCALPAMAQEPEQLVAQTITGATGRETVTREKARLVLFDGETLTLERLSAAPESGAATDARFSVVVTPQTRYVGTTAAAFADIKAGGFAGAAVTEDSGGRLRARQLYLYPDALRGTGEGRFPENGRIMINGVVSAVTFASDTDRSRGSLTLAYRGSVLTPLGRGRTVCEGRAAPAAVASPLECKAEAMVQVRANTPVTAMSVGDRSLLEPGVTVTVTVVTGPDGRAVTPGMVIEKADTVEKPQSAP